MNIAGATLLPVADQTVFFLDDRKATKSALSENEYLQSSIRPLTDRMRDNKEARENIVSRAARLR